MVRVAQQHHLPWKEEATTENDLYLSWRVWYNHTVTKSSFQNYMLCEALMQKKVQIISDGSQDLSPELSKEKDIEFVPFYVSFDGNSGYT